jgi:hypothetical protein
MTTSETYLGPTPWCDSNHPSIRELAFELTRDAHTAREAAVALFYWVRDSIAYTMGDWNQRASETIARRVGTCSNKSNVMVALARAIGIPAGFHVQYVATPAYFSGAYIPLVAGLTRDVAIHVYPALFIEGSWVRCDPTDDRALCDSIEAIVPHATALDFDGITDAVIPFAAGSIQSDRGPLSNVDEQLSKPCRLTSASKRMFALFVAYLRDHGRRYEVDSKATRARIEADFCRHVLAVDPEAHAELIAQPVARAA